MKKESKNKRIWIFHPTATPPTMTGLTRPYYFGRNLIKKGYQVKVFSASHLHYSNKNLITNKDLYQINEETEVPHIFVRTYSSMGNGIARVFNMLSYYKNLIKTAKKLNEQGEQPDLIIASSPHPLALLAGVRLKRKYQIPLISEVRDFWPEVFFKAGKIKEKSLIGRLLLQGEYWLYQQSDALIFLKEGDPTYITGRQWDQMHGGKIDLSKVHYINNGVDLVDFKNLQHSKVYQDPDLTEENFNVVYTGAIRMVNNIDLMLDAAKLLTDYKDIQFLIYGDGNQLADLRKRIANENIPNVKLKGYVNQEYIPSLLDQSSVNVLNYAQDLYNWSRGNSSNKLFNYMAAGKPIISTVQMGYSPIVHYQCGLELENNRAEDLATAILQIKEMDAASYQTMARNAAQAAHDFDYQSLTNKLLKVVEELI